MRLGRLMLLLLCLQVNNACSQMGGVKISAADLKNQTFEAKVIRILDGDTMEVLYENSRIKIRLAHIDCPEKRSAQPFGNDAKQALSDLCFGHNVTVQKEKYDRYGRLIAVILNNKNQVVNQEMVKQGLAWHFKKYSTDPLYAQLELEAKKNKKGLWAQINPIAPWEWRKPNLKSF